MAAIILPPEAYIATKLDTEINTEEVKLESDEASSDVEGEGEAVDGISIFKHGKKKPTKPKHGKPPKNDYSIMPVPPDDYLQPVPYPPKDPIHPVPPSGNLFEDVYTHFQCQNLYVQNIHQLIEKFKLIQKDNEQKDREIKRLQWENYKLREDLDDTIDERDQLKEDFHNEREAHIRTKEKLVKVSAELVQLEARYEEVLHNLREVRHELAEACKEIRQLKSDIAYKTTRIHDLENKLRIANAGEDAANDRVTALQKYIYELESKKAHIEREKDYQQGLTRIYEDQVVDLKRRLRESKKRSTGANTYGAEEIESIEVESSRLESSRAEYREGEAYGDN